MPLNKPGRSGGILPYLFLYIPVVWAALLIAQSLGDGLPELLRWRHRLYLSAVPGVENDAIVILEAAQAVAMVFAPDGAPVPQPHRTGVLGGVFR